MMTKLPEKNGKMHTEKTPNTSHICIYIHIHIHIYIYTYIYIYIQYIYIGTHKCFK